jgi:hypothetical protein
MCYFSKQQNYDTQNYARDGPILPPSSHNFQRNIVCGDLLSTTHADI